ncbi:MAG: metal-dependent transcriptional regulator [Cyclobacteriaceae bacterium]|nr:metal-dependent transcriptional regulator [Cyclobacteriaceae bacterium HetDA_MAG_MS6]
MDTLLSFTEENYLKSIYHLSRGGTAEVSTNALADDMQNKPATVSDMIKRLSKKSLISYTKYKGVNVTVAGKKIALQVIRKHRLWEVFLVEKLNFNWDEVHEIAEQLEHIKSPLLVERLDAFLEHPTVDPHGDPIPDSMGNFNIGPKVLLSEMIEEEAGVITGVDDSDPKFLQYLDKVNIRLGTKFKVKEKIEFDSSMHIVIENQDPLFLSEKIANSLTITKLK